MLLRNFIIFCLVMGLFTAVLSKLVVDFRVERKAPGINRMLWSPSPYLIK